MQHDVNWEKTFRVVSKAGTAQLTKEIRPTSWSNCQQKDRPQFNHGSDYSIPAVHSTCIFTFWSFVLQNESHRCREPSLNINRAMPLHWSFYQTNFFIITINSFRFPSVRLNWFEAMGISNFYLKSNWWNDSLMRKPACCKLVLKQSFRPFRYWRFNIFSMVKCK